MKLTKPRYVIRRGDSEGPEKFLDYRGQWVDYKQAKQFKSADAADKFADKKGIVNCGIFPRSVPRKINRPGKHKNKPNVTPEQAASIIAKAPKPLKR